MAILESQEVTSDTELLAVADTLLSMSSQPTTQQMPPPINTLLSPSKIVTDIPSRTVSELSQLIVQILDTLRF